MEVIRLENIEIIKYVPHYAESLAKMWNMSSENWGGYDHLVTAEDVREENKDTDNINIYLAVDRDNEEVVGYCSFSEYENDEGALYIPLLNVRPDYQGKKIGKALVLKTVERTIELGWPRLDLYTWAGNTKAVPLYKKCGFFWEKNDGATHLMNFIPQVLQTEALSGYFDNLDWYNDSKRDLTIVPDGNPGDDYCHYDYHWSKADSQLSVGIERRGRGLRRIETDDYLIEARLEESKVVIGRSYQVCYHIENKTGKKLNIAIEGQDDKNISFSFKEERRVQDSLELKGEFFVGKPLEDNQKEDRTHPSVSAVIKINGKKALFKTGIKPVYPLEIALNIPDVRQFQGIRSSLYIDLENNYDQKTSFCFNLPSTSDLEFIRNNWKVELKAGEKKSVKVNYYLIHNCVYSAELNFKAMLEDGNCYRFLRKVTAVFSGRYGKFGGETDKGWVLNNGAHSVRLNKDNNQLKIIGFEKEKIKSSILQPKLGLPFSREFSQKKPEKVEYFNDRDAYCMRAIYESDDFPNIHLISIVKLYSDGLVENYYKVYNMGEKVIDDGLALRHSFYHQLVDTYLAYNDKVVEISGSAAYELDYWNRDNISENWFYSSDQRGSRGVVWSEFNRLKFNGWYFSLDYKFAELAPGDYIKTEPLYISHNLFEDYSEIRRFALGQLNPDEKKVADKFEVTINEGNPFVEQDFVVQFREYRETAETGRVVIESSDNGFTPLKKDLFANEGTGDEDQIDQVNVKPTTNTQICKQDEKNCEISENRFEKIKRLSFNIDLSARKFTRDGLILVKGKGEVKTALNREEGYNVYKANNGVIQIKSAPDFAHAIYSLQYNGREWLDNSFPKAGPKSWWNPWFGGSSSRPNKLRNSSMLEEETRAKFVSLTDNYDNNWQGIKVMTEINKNDLFRGLVQEQYYMMLSGLPIVCITTEIKQNTGRFFNYESFNQEFNLKPDNKLKESWIQLKKKSGEIVKYKAGRVGFELNTDSSLVFGGEQTDEIIQVYGSGECEYVGFTNLELIGGQVTNKICLADKGSLFTPPVFIFITEEPISNHLLKDLDNIDFN